MKLFKTRRPMAIKNNAAPARISAIKQPFNAVLHYLVKVNRELNDLGLR